MHTFNILEYRDEMRKAGFSAENAEIIAKVNEKAFNDMFEIKDLTTKNDLTIAIQGLKIDLKDLISSNTCKIIGFLASFQILMTGAMAFIQHFVK